MQHGNDLVKKKEAPICYPDRDIHDASFLIYLSELVRIQYDYITTSLELGLGHSLDQPLDGIPKATRHLRKRISPSSNFFGAKSCLDVFFL
jgi:hypothetical protein